MRSVIFLAPPLSGKGTFSDYLVENYGYKQISTGDITEVVKSSYGERNYYGYCFR